MNFAESAGAAPIGYMHETVTSTGASLTCPFCINRYNVRFGTYSCDSLRVQLRA